MPTEELLDDHDMDRALRDLRMPAPRSREWERALRSDLMEFIISGTVRERVSPDLSGAAAPRAKMLLVGAACVAVLLAGVALSARDAEPAQGPVTTTRPPLSVDPPRVDRFPLLPATDPRANSATAMYGNQIGWDNPPKSEALVARIEGDTMTEAVVLSVSGNSAALPFGSSATETVNVAGTDMQLFVEGGTPVLKTVVLPGIPTFFATGLDPVAFLELAGGFPIEETQVDADGEVSFAIGALPEGYEVIVPPTRLPRGSFDVSLRVADDPDADGISVWVGVRNSLLGEAEAGDLRRVDINGVSGWMRDDGPRSPVVWQVSETAWATIGGAATVDEALEFARSLTFVDEATWRARYGLEDPSYPAKAIALQPPPSTLPEPTQLIVSLRTIESDTLETPIACGGTPYVDTQVLEPIATEDEGMALETFLATADAARLFDLGYEEVFVRRPGNYRFERHNNVGDLVTVIYVELLDGGWAVTRWQASAC